MKKKQNIVEEKTYAFALKIIHIYKEMLEQKKPLFDLAAIESTAPDGTRASFVRDGKTYYQMVSDYTHDGGHLNELGQKRVAEQLLVFLAGLCK